MKFPVNQIPIVIPRDDDFCLRVYEILLDLKLLKACLVTGTFSFAKDDPEAFVCVQPDGEFVLH